MLKCAQFSGAKLVYLDCLAFLSLELCTYALLFITIFCRHWIPHWMLIDGCVDSQTTDTSVQLAQEWLDFTVALTT